MVRETLSRGREMFDITCGGLTGRGWSLGAFEIEYIEQGFGQERKMVRETLSGGWLDAL